MSNNIGEAFTITLKYLMQTRNEEYLQQTEQKTEAYERKATNIITHIKKLSRYNDAIKKNYAALSEKSHPNHDGLFGLYAKRSSNTIYFEEKGIEEILLSTTSIKDAGKQFYEGINSVLDLLNKHEKEIKKYYKNPENI